MLCERAWLDAAAVRQLEHAARGLRGVRLAVGMPDLHPGQAESLQRGVEVSDIVNMAAICVLKAQSIAEGRWEVPSEKAAKKK